MYATSVSSTSVIYRHCNIFKILTSNFKTYVSVLTIIIIPPWTGLPVAWAKLSIVGPRVGHGECGVSMASVGQCGS